MMSTQKGDTQKPAFFLTKPVFFVGFMGAGKTSVSRRVARKAHIASIDADKYLERREGKKITAIFEECGEEGFRSIETEVLSELSLGEPALISCGGGVVLRPENRDILQERGFVIYLMVSADEASSRIKDLSTRPLFKTIENARTTHEERAPIYREVADVIIDTAGKSIGRIAYEVTRELKKAGILCQIQK